MPQIICSIFRLHPGQGLFPVEAGVAVILRPHESGGVIRDGAIPVVRKAVLTVSGVFAHIEGKETFAFGLPWHRSGWIAFDATIGKIDAEHGLIAIHGCGDIFSGGGQSPVITGNGLFFNPVPWLLLAGFVLAASILLWIPLVKNITRPIARITDAAEEIARSNFNVHIEDQRKDEIGRLGAAINHMSGQLENHIMGQKRFLGDMAHELASPIAQMELGLSIFEQRLKGEDQDGLKDITEEVRHMSNLISELLSFTRAEIASERLTAKTVPLRPIVGLVMDREGAADAEIMNRVADDISVWAVDSLFHRALSNILRNAIRYAGQAGPIEIAAHREGDKVLLAVNDQGPWRT